MNLNIIRVAILLARRQLQHAGILLKVLIVFVMMLTFISLVIVSGILTGIIEGSKIVNRSQLTGDVFITTYSNEKNIERTRDIVATLDRMPEVTNYTARMIENGQVEANYKTRRDFQNKADLAGAQIVGIDIDKELATSALDDFLVEGEFLDPNEEGYVVLGANLLKRYASGFGDGISTMDNVYPGDKIRVTVNGAPRFADIIQPQDGAGGITKEFTVKGIIKTKVGEMSMRVFMSDKEFRRLFSRTNLNANEIMIEHTDNINDSELELLLRDKGFGEYGKITTAENSIPQFLLDVQTLFRQLGNMIGFIGLVVAVITVFIVIFINALTRRKYIGILKAIGVRRESIMLAYALQSFAYAVIGAGIGLLLTYLVFVPLFEAHPLDFPFADGILAVPFEQTMIKLALMIVITIFAGFIPAYLIVKQNTLDSILGRVK